jgi:hypothetical protein
MGIEGMPGNNQPPQKTPEEVGEEMMNGAEKASSRLREKQYRELASRFGFHEETVKEFLTSIKYNGMMCGFSIRGHEVAIIKTMSTSELPQIIQSGVDEVQKSCVVTVDGQFADNITENAGAEILKKYVPLLQLYFKLENTSNLESEDVIEKKQKLAIEDLLR